MRLLAYAGVLAVALWLAGALVINLFTDLRGNTASPEERLLHFREDPHKIFLGGFLFQLGCVAFVFFLGGLRARLVVAEGGVGTLSAVAFGGGLGTAVFAFGIFGGHMGGALERETLTPASADVLARVGDLEFQAAKLCAIPLLIACALVAIRTAVLPRTHAWVSLALALSLAVPHTGWLSLLYGFPVWVVATSLLLARTSPPGGASRGNAVPP